QEKLKKALAEDILFGELSENGGEVFVSTDEGGIKLDVKGRKKQEKRELSKSKS
ncbi:MAG: hypothetical protein ACI85S_000793, partial [Pseudohongiellaceae bacterium]